MRDESELRERIVDAALALAERHSWEAVRLHDAAAAVGATLDQARLCFAEKEDVVEAWFDRADRAMLGLAEQPEFLALSARQRVHRLIMTWLGALAAHRQVTRQMIYGKFEPGHLHIQIPGLMRVSRTVQWVREAAQRDVAYVRRALDETVLTTIYLATFFHWMHDDATDSANTARFLDGALAAAESLSGLVFDRPDEADPRPLRPRVQPPAGDILDP